MPTVLQSGSLKLLEPSGPVQTCNGIAVPFFNFLLLVITFRQGICNYMPETNHVYNITATLCLQCMVHVMLLPMTNVLYFHIITFRSKCAAPCIVFCAVIICCHLYARYLQLHLERTMFPRYTVLQLFSVYNSWHTLCYFP